MNEHLIFCSLCCSCAGCDAVFVFRLTHSVVVMWTELVMNDRPSFMLTCRYTTLKRKEQTSIFIPIFVTLKASKSCNVAQQDPKQQKTRPTGFRETWVPKTTPLDFSYIFYTKMFSCMKNALQTTIGSLTELCRVLVNFCWSQLSSVSNIW